MEQRGVRGKARQAADADRTLFCARPTSVGDRADLLAAVVSVSKAMGGGWVTEADNLSCGGN